MTEYVFEEYRKKFAEVIQEFSRHIIPAWYLSNTKREIMRPLQRRLSLMFCTTDFAENIVAHRKYELAEQHFHKIEILLFGAVVSIIEENDEGEMIMHQYSYMISSDYRYYL